MTKKTARQAVAEGLINVNQHGGYSNLVLNGLLRKNDIEGRDVAFASALFYGTLERKLTLDHVICNYSNKPLKALGAEVTEILRLSIYQLLYMESVPEAAAVDEGVKLTKSMNATSASGFVNGVLRSFIREGKRVPQVKGNRSKKLEIRYSCPRWLIQALMEEYSEEEMISLLEHSLGRPKLYAKVNTTKITANDCIERLKAEGIFAQEDPLLPECLILSATSGVEDSPSFVQGLFHIQDKSSQLCAAALGAAPGESVLDLCGAPGSKAFTVAQIMQDKGKIFSCDLTPQKVERISQGIKRLGLNIVMPQCNDATVFNPDYGLFDRVICDVPCSGMGIISRKPEIKYKDHKGLKDLPKIQKDILQAASGYVRPGGTLLYSTCTILPEENEKVVDAFLANNNNFEAQPLSKQVWAAGGKQTQPDWRLTLLPFMAQTDGFFMALIKRKEQ